MLAQVRADALLAVAIDVRAGAAIEGAEFVLAALDIVLVRAPLADGSSNERAGDDAADDRACTGAVVMMMPTAAADQRYAAVTIIDRRLAERRG